MLPRLPSDARERFTPHTEEFDVGSIAGGYVEIGYHVMQRYLFADDVEAVAGVRGEDLGAEFPCHHGGSLVNLRVVSLQPDEELTLISDQPTTPYVTTRMSDAPENWTSVTRSFLWETPSDPDVAEGLGQMMEAMIAAGEVAITEVFEARA